MPFTNMITNTQYMCYIRHKQATVNKWIRAEKKSYWKPEKSLMKKFTCSKEFLKIQLFHRYFYKILPKHFRTLTERSTPFSDTCLKFTAIFVRLQ